MKLCVINLERRPDRKHTVAEQFAKSGYAINTITWMRAVDGRTLEMTPELSRLFRNNNFDSNAAVMACALSHLETIRNFLASDDRDVAIFEDDVRFSHWVRPGMFEMIAGAHVHKCDVVFLGYTTTTAYDIPSIGTLGSMPLDPSKYIGGAFGYILFRSGAEKILREFARGIPEAVDIMYRNMMASGELVAYEVGPRIVLTDFVDNYVSSTVDSDIQRATRILPCTEVESRMIMLYDVHAEHSFEIVRDQLVNVHFSGLYKRLHRIYVCFSDDVDGDVHEFLRNCGAKVVVVDAPSELRTHLCPDDIVLYVRVQTLTWKQRTLNDYLLIHRYAQCVEKLNTFDVVGINEGFWWARAKQIATDDFSSVFTDGPNVNRPCLFETLDVPFASLL